MRLVVHAVRMCLLCALVLCGSLLAQTAPGSVHGQITDPSGAVVVKATVMATGSNGETLSTASSNKGSYEIKGLTPGEYRLSVTAKGFSPKTLQVVIAAGTAQAQDIALEIAVAQTDVTVEEDSRTLSTAASANAGAVVLKGKELDVLSDDPDEMAEDLKQLAGPSLGPDGGEMYIDGFSSGTLPPKSSIREVRINSNPLSAQFDRPGFSGRTEIFTKPGSGTFHGQFQINGNDGIFNAVSPILLPETVNPGSHILTACTTSRMKGSLPNCERNTK